MELDTIRFYKSPGETGTHIGRIWGASGNELAQVTFAGETSFGWQEQALPSPLILYPNRTYVVSINANAYYVATQAGLATQVSNGPLHSIADGANGVYGSSRGGLPAVQLQLEQLLRRRRRRQHDAGPADRNADVSDGWRNRRQCLHRSPSDVLTLDGPRVDHSVVIHPEERERLRGSRHRLV